MADQSYSSLYDTWFRVLSASFAAMTPGGIAGVAPFARPAPEETDGAANPMQAAFSTAQQAFSNLYLGYANALGANGSMRSLEDWLKAAPAELKKTFEQLSASIKVPMLPAALDPRVPSPLAAGMGHAFTALADALGLAPTRELRAAYRELLAAMAEQRTQQVKYLAYLASEWSKVGDRLVKRLREMGERGEKVDSLLAFVRLWAVVADDVLHDAMQSQKGVSYTTAYMRSAARARQQRNRLIEIGSEFVGVPTRAEIDEVHREIHEIKKHLRRAAREQDEPAPPRRRPRAVQARQGRRSK